VDTTYRDLFRWEGEPDEGRVLLFDGNSFAYRAFYAVSELSTRDGRPVNALFGFWKLFQRIVRSFPSAYVGVAFDAGGRTFRHELLSAYKATRREMPEDLAAQMPLIRSLLLSLGIPVTEKEGVEADDLLAALARGAARSGKTVLIATSDKDLAQLVGERIALLRPSGRGAEGEVEVLDAAGVVARFGVLPERIVDFLALVGDTSDNVPGVPGVGEKTAAKLLGEFGTLDAVLEHAHEVRNVRVRDSLKAHAEAAHLAQRLVTLDEATWVGDPLEACRLRGVDLPRLESFLRDVEFQSLLRELKLEELSPTATDQPEGERADYRPVLERSDLERLVADLTKVEAFAIDLETTSLDPIRAEIVGIALSSRPGEGYYIPVGHDYLGAPAQLPLSDVVLALRPLIEAEPPRLIGQNLKYDLVVLRRHGLRPRGISFDTMIASHLARPDARSHSLAEVARVYLGYRVQTYEELAGKGGQIASVSVEKATFYAAEDAEIAHRLVAPLRRALEEVGATKLFEDVEVPLVSVLARMEEAGILVDREVLSAQGAEIRAKLHRIEEDLFDIAGERFNPSSPKQVALVLFDHLKLPVLERTKTGPSTSASVLSELAAQHPLPGKLLDHRELEKLLNTYIERLPEAINPATGRVHTSFHQTSTATGRLSSSDPNLQNIPIRTEVGERIRRAFVAPDGWCLVGADYSQIELRVLGHLSQDEALIETFRAGKDLHRMMAARIFGLPEDAVTPKLRDAAKRINFGILYGISPYGLARELGIPQEQARAYIERFFAAFPKAKEKMDLMVEEATQRGYAETLLGRRRPLPNLTSRNVGLRNFDRRNAINTPIQGSAADLIKLAMLAIDRAAEAGDLKARMLLQIHDELLFEVPQEARDEAKAKIKRLMETVMDLAVPLEVAVKSGANWSEV
jgi:DNA polymerase-1